MEGENKYCVSVFRKGNVDREKFFAIWLKLIKSEVCRTSERGERP